MSKQSNKSSHAHFLPLSFSLSLRGHQNGAHTLHAGQFASLATFIARMSTRRAEFNGPAMNSGMFILSALINAPQKACCLSFHPSLNDYFSAKRRAALLVQSICYLFICTFKYLFDYLSSFFFFFFVEHPTVAMCWERNGVMFN